MYIGMYTVTLFSSTCKTVSGTCRKQNVAATETATSIASSLYSESHAIVFSHAMSWACVDHLPLTDVSWTIFSSSYCHLVLLTIKQLSSFSKLELGISHHSSPLSSDINQNETPTRLALLLVGVHSRLIEVEGQAHDKWYPG
jgi:hypothetical protein